MVHDNARHKRLYKDLSGDTLDIVLDQFEYYYDKNRSEKRRIVYYSLYLQGDKFFGDRVFNDEANLKADDWEYDLDKNYGQEELLLSNAVLVLNEVFNNLDFLFHNGSKYEAMGIKKIRFFSYIGDLSENSTKVLAEHYFEQPFESIKTNELE